MYAHVQKQLKLVRSEIKPVLEELKRYYRFQLFDTKISRSVTLSEAPSFGEPINYYSKYSKVSLEYKKLAEEIVSRIEGF